ncbi:MAG: T9SS type A sorting domain-containing protein [Bacteroidia bacterium]
MSNLNTKEEVAAVEAYPNPNHGQFKVSIDSKVERKYSLSLLDQAGRVLRQIDVNATEGLTVQEFDLDGIAAGMYFLRVESLGLETINKQIVIQ